MEHGLTDDVIGDKVTNETGYYIRVTGYDGAWSTEPYVLRVKVNPPQGHGADFSYPAGSDRPGHRLRTAPNPIETIFVTNFSRMSQYYPADNFTALETRLRTFADRTDVNGMILALDGDAGRAGGLSSLGHKRYRRPQRQPMTSPPPYGHFCTPGYRLTKMT